MYNLPLQHKLYLLGAILLSLLSWCDSNQETFTRRRRLSDSSGGVYFLQGSHSKFPLSQGLDGKWYCANGDILEDPVVVVGTDGSGTRVIAKMLSMLGVTVLVEHGVSSQMDVDGRLAGVHFTDPIRHVLSETQSAYYLPSNPPLSQHVLDEGHHLIQNFAKTMRFNACLAGVGKSKRKLWAFKKPDLMNLLPFLSESFPHMQVLHVVRDGRDMAFSKNTSPLKKYGSSLKPSLEASMKRAIESIKEQGGGSFTTSSVHTFSEPERQIAVWNHENEGVAKWGHQNLDRYKWIRIEDFNSQNFLNDTMNPYYHMIRELSKQGGGGLDNDLIPSHEQIEAVMTELRGKPMGSHDHSSSSSTNSTKQHYGKWLELASQQEITRLEAIGSTSLHNFGYLPGGTLASGKAR